MKAKRLKKILIDALAKVNELSDDDELKVVNKTCCLGDCDVFLGLLTEGYVNLSKLGVERSYSIAINDIDLCIAIDPNDNPEQLKTFDELIALSESHHVQIKLERERCESGWPSFMIEGHPDDVYDLLIELGFDEETANEWVIEAVDATSK